MQLTLRLRLCWLQLAKIIYRMRQRFFPAILPQFSFEPAAGIVSRTAFAECVGVAGARDSAVCRKIKIISASSRCRDQPLIAVIILDYLLLLPGLMRERPKCHVQKIKRTRRLMKQQQSVITNETNKKLPLCEANTKRIVRHISISIWARIPRQLYCYCCYFCIYSATVAFVKLKQFVTLGQVCQRCFVFVTSGGCIISPQSEVSLGLIMYTHIILKYFCVL